MVEIYLIRHGETYLNKEGRISGQIETDLTDLGRQQAEQTANTLVTQNIFFDVILCSCLRRACQTAEIIAKKVPAPIVKLEGLKEISCGVLEGASLAKLEDIEYNPPYECGGFKMHNAEEVRQNYSSFDPKYDEIAHPGGETKAEARERFMQTVKEYLDAHPKINKIAVVAHGAVIRFTLLKICPETVKEKLKNAELRKICYDQDKGFFA